MISASYINNGCVDSFFEKAFEHYDKEVFSLMNDANNSYIELRINTDLIMLESEIMGELENSQTAILEAEGQNFIKKIGQTLISLFESFVKFVDSIVQKLKDFNFRLKSNEKKMNSLVKNHPELTKEKIQILADEGGLDFSDFKSLAELDKEFFKIVEMSKKTDVKPDSLKGKWEAAKKKLNMQDSTVKTITTVATAATATISLALAIKKFKGDVAKSHKDAIVSKNQIRRVKAAAFAAISQDNPDSDNWGKANVLLGIYRELQGKHQKAIQHDASILNKMSNAIASAIDKVLDSAASKSILGNTKDSIHADLLHIYDHDKQRSEW